MSGVPLPRNRADVEQGQDRETPMAAEMYGQERSAMHRLHTASRAWRLAQKQGDGQVHLRPSSERRMRFRAFACLSSMAIASSAGPPIDPCSSSIISSGSNTMGRKRSSWSLSSASGVCASSEGSIVTTSISSSISSSSMTSCCGCMSNSSSRSSYSSFSSNSLKSGAKADQFSEYRLVHTYTTPDLAQHARMGRVGWHAKYKGPSLGPYRIVSRWPCTSQMKIESLLYAVPMTCSLAEKSA
mmetsp:Transcript_7521/g.15684  ORF Transcript_7521/g.15684 Transcript_7521/m.15684 type:complete len:242 (-) Transcript_7521:278-1003(-)